ncbi:preprotein translocase subunit YajC [Aminipila butyrica]|uniref:Preprotein translocase subunit YajC n=1 Tax=Aminipila butyrica TaxID=433296 RepID=A0A858BTW3_9FIRM|nr:preprotein translocase subunit YajC [Aminipila butyrica]QIB69461.1 preprotein translocase subunit YajC [Aminipila butyrica]
MGSLYQNLLPLVLLIVIMYFLLIRPQKKKEKAVTEMRNSIKAGDEIITIGGICGKVVKVKDETIVIQVGAEKLKFEMMKWSVSKVVNSEESKVSPKKARPSEDTEETTKKALPKRLKKDAEADSEEVPAAQEDSSVEDSKQE